MSKEYLPFTDEEREQRIESAGPRWGMAPMWKRDIMRYEATIAQLEKQHKERVEDLEANCLACYHAELMAENPPEL